jgi:hypothetical protein
VTRPAAPGVVPTAPFCSRASYNTLGSRISLSPWWDTRFARGSYSFSPRSEEMLRSGFVLASRTISSRFTRSLAPSPAALGTPFRSACIRFTHALFALGSVETLLSLYSEQTFFLLRSCDSCSARKGLSLAPFVRPFRRAQSSPYASSSRVLRRARLSTLPGDTRCAREMSSRSTRTGYSLRSGVAPLRILALLARVSARYARRLSRSARTPASALLASPVDPPLGPTLFPDQRVIPIVGVVGVSQPTCDESARAFAQRRRDPP